MTVPRAAGGRLGAPTSFSIIWSLVKDAAAGWLADDAPSMGAAIAFYTAFSVAPLLVIAIAIAGMFFGADAAQGYIFEQSRGLLGYQAASALQQMVKNANAPMQGMFASLTSLVAILLGAAGVFSELQSSIDRIWQMPAGKASAGFWGAVQRRLLVYGLILALVFLLIVSLIVSSVVAALGRQWTSFGLPWEWALQALNVAIGFVVTASLFIIMFKLLPRVQLAWSDVMGGGVVTAALFEFGKLLIGLYLGGGATTSSFGAAGALATLLLWVYYSSQLFLFGAEITWVYATRFGSRKEAGTGGG